MALISYGIQLTSKAINAGPDFAVEYSTDCVNYTFAGRVTLQDTASIGYVDIEETSTCIKLESVGNCTNYVVSGSTPSSSSYNTYLATLTQKNGSGPEFIVSQDTGSGLFNTFDTIELPAQGASTPIEPDENALAIRFRSNGVCQTSKTIQIAGPTPTPSPTPSPTPAPPTPSPTPAPTATPAPTPSSCFAVDVYQSPFSATDACCNVVSTVAYLNGTSLLTATVAYSQKNFNCSDVLSEPTWMTQDTRDYYFWNGSSFSGPTSCPGCP